MAIVLLCERVLGKPAADGRVVAAGTEVVEVEVYSIACTPFLALELYWVDALCCTTCAL